MKESFCEIKLSGMHCHSCVRKIEELLKKSNFFYSWNVDLSSESIRGRLRLQNLSKKEFKSSLTNLLNGSSFELRDLHFFHTQEDYELQKTSDKSWLQVLLVGVFLSLIIFLLPFFLDHALANYLSFALALWGQFYLGEPYYRSAFLKLKKKEFNMDFLVSLGSLCAFLLSSYLLFFKSAHLHLYFLESVSIFTLISLGHFLEARLISQLNSTLRGLSSLIPNFASRKNSDGMIEKVKLSELRVGQLIQVLPGEMIPADSIVFSGSSYVDEAIINGESQARAIEKGDLVSASSLNVDGVLELKVQKEITENEIHKVVESLKQLQNSETKTQRIADRLSSYFIPFIIAIAFLTFVLWTFYAETLQLHVASISQLLWNPIWVDYSLEEILIVAISVLIISCPCALGLATPVALMAANNTAAKLGFSFQDARALEEVKAVDVLLLDKTGTLTDGKFELNSLKVFQNLNEKFVKNTAASLAAYSRHPLSQSLKKLELQDHEFEKIKEFSGKGVEAYDVETQSLFRLGSLKWFLELGIINEESYQSFKEEFSGYSLVAHSRENEIIALFSFFDNELKDLPELLEKLCDRFQRVCVLSGDTQSSVAEFSKRINNSQVTYFSEMTPHKKMELIAGLQSESKKVAFVGDGLNDVLAIEKADLGIAVSTATKLSQKAADIILMKNKIHQLPEIFNLVTKTFRVIRLNYLWAFVYNVVAIPLAALGFIHPLLCAFSMAFSDVLIVLNSMSLLNFRIKKSS